MKKLLKTLAGTVCLLSIILAGAENPDGSICLPWTLGFMAAAAIGAYLYNRIDGHERGRRG